MEVFITADDENVFPCIGSNKDD